LGRSCRKLIIRRPIGTALSEVLRRFSFDVVGIVAGYLVSGIATAGAEPKLCLSIGSCGHRDGAFIGGCCAIACASDGKLWTSDGRRVQVFDSEGEFLFRVPYNFQSPVDIAIDDASGEAFIADEGANAVVVCALDDGRLLRLFDDSCQWPRGVAVSLAGLVLVCCSSRHGVKVFRRDGRLVAVWGKTRLTPYKLAINSRDQAFVSDCLVTGERIVKVRRGCILAV
jgi:hypothetical protein